MNVQNVFLSVITVNLNNASGLARTITSVSRQSFKSKELIIIDGGSNDCSLDVIKANESGIKHWISEKDKGVYNGMNKGLDKAVGKYILFLNSGDYLASDDILANACSAIETDDDIVYGDLFLEKDNVIYDRKRYPDKLTFKYFFHGLESLPHPSTFIKKSLFDKVGLYSEKFRIVSDWEFALKAIFLYQAKYRHIPYGISVFNMEGISSLTTNENLVIAEKSQVYEKYFSGIVDDYKEMNAANNITFEITSVRQALAHSLRRRWKNIRNLFR